MRVGVQKVFESTGRVGANGIASWNAPSVTVDGAELRTLVADFSHP